jgi:PPK2 family polyphosphate:nucleotide phosphotransferase
MLELPDSPWRVPFDGSFRVDTTRRRPPDEYDKAECEARLKELKRELFDLQHRFYALDRHSLLLVFQAMDAAGKDSTIRAVMSGVNPAGCQVFSFKQPSSEELDHDFLWRTAKRLPERGRIGIFNRSYYEEVIVVRVHPELLAKQRLPEEKIGAKFWDGRYRSIRDHERHLAASGTIVLKFFLNVSQQEQKKRFLSRLDTPEKNWKFSPHDYEERKYWHDYMTAYETALNETSRPWAPWYAIPADKKPFTRLQVCEIVVETLRSLRLEFPQPSAEARQQMALIRESLANET